MSQTLDDAVLQRNIDAQVDMLRRDLGRIEECVLAQGYHRWTNYEQAVPSFRAAFSALADPSSPLHTRPPAHTVIPRVAAYGTDPEPGRGDKRLFVDVELRDYTAVVTDREFSTRKAYTLKVYPFHAYPQPQELPGHMAVERPDSYMTLPWRIPVSDKTALDLLIDEIRHVLNSQSWM